MNIVIAGASGFLGSSLKDFFLSKNYNVASLSRNDFNNNNLLEKKLTDTNIIINFAGESIIKRWNTKNKQKILKSRISTTQKIIYYLNSSKKGIHVINASAIGIYDSFSKHDESSTQYSNNFLSDVIRNWEREAYLLNVNRNNLSIVRIGLVLGNRGGAFKKFYAITKNFIGGKLSNGNQSMSFIHIDDFCNAIDFIISHKLYGVVNLTAPEPSTNKKFVKTLGNYLNRPTFFTVPKFALKILFGDAHILFTEGQYVKPKKLITNNFQFKYSNIEASIKALINTYPK